MLQTDFADLVGVDPKRIKQAKIAKQLWLKPEKQAPVQGRIVVEQGAIFVGDRRFEPEEIAQMVLVSDLNKTVQSGFLDLAFQTTRGNTQSESSRIDFEWKIRRLSSRHTLKVGLAEQTQESERIESSRLGRYQYDYFVAANWYLYGTAALQSDKIKGIDYRRELGAGAGYQFIETEKTQASLDIGASYETEKIEAATSDSKTAGRWQLQLRHHIFSSRLQLFHDHEGLWFEENTDYRLSARTGLRVALMAQLSATLQRRDEYHDKPLDGVKKHDETLLATLGYVW